MRIGFLILFWTVYSWAGSTVNALIREESPYLQQHAHNPVHWLPWGEAAFEKAKREQKPIFLSIGYSTCHWCHVMERESFENPEVAKLLNRYFVAIKVDREERPQIDRYYQTVHRLLTRRPGGWPLTILLTPDRKPFFAATYLPREERYGQPGLLDLLRSAAATWRERPEEIRNIAEKVDAAMGSLERRDPAHTSATLDQGLAKRFVDELEKEFDREYGGWGMQPKFPRAMTLVALLKLYGLNGDPRALKMADKTLEAMALGGIYDQVEGGFYRYSTDRKWTIPHFEKMLYSNAELLEAYALGARITGRPLYRRIVRETVRVLERHYRDAEGLFYGASDADSRIPGSEEKEEGYYYTYRYGTLLPLLKKAGIPDPQEALAGWGITEEGNFIKFRSNPTLRREGAGGLKVRKVLRELRRKRPYPFIDRKLQCSWNALWIHALFSAAEIDRRYGVLALETLESLYRQLYRGGRLYHQKLPGRSPKVPALLEDYSFLLAATLDAREWSGDLRWLERAKALEAEARTRFRHDGTWYDSSGKFRNPMDLEGGAYRSPLAVLADSDLRLALLTGDPAYEARAREILHRNASLLERYPRAAPAGVLAALARRYGYILLKLPRERYDRLRSRIAREILYPFLESREASDDLCQACRIGSCFLYDRNATRFTDRLKKRLAPHAFR